MGNNLQKKNKLVERVREIRTKAAKKTCNLLLDDDEAALTSSRHPAEIAKVLTLLANKN
jgi:hypothetical protein